MRIQVRESTIYHEAGHAAAFWHYHIPIQYVSLRPDFTKGYGGMVVTAESPPTAGQTELRNWMHASAAGQIAEANCQGRPRLTYDDLLTRFRRAAADIANAPDPPRHDDMRNYAGLGILRDRQAEKETDKPPETGPATWITVWLEAEQLVRDQLWPAIKAIAGRLLATVNAHVGQDVATLPDLMGQDVCALAAEAMKTSPTLADAHDH